jgi:hypothetical protein
MDMVRLNRFLHFSHLKSYVGMVDLLCESPCLSAGGSAAGLLKTLGPCIPHPLFEEQRGESMSVHRSNHIVSGGFVNTGETGIKVKEKGERRKDRGQRIKGKGISIKD